MGVWLKKRLILSEKGGVKEEKLSEPGFEGWLVEDTHSKMRDHNEQKGIN